MGCSEEAGEMVVEKDVAAMERGGMPGPARTSGQPLQVQ